MHRITQRGIASRQGRGDDTRVRRALLCALLTGADCGSTPLVSADAASPADVLVDAAPVGPHDATPTAPDATPTAPDAGPADALADDAAPFDDAGPTEDAAPTSDDASAPNEDASAPDDDAQPAFPDAAPGPPLDIAFSSNRSGEYDIFLTDLAGTTTRQLTMANGDDFYPSFSSDGARVVFSGSGGLFEIALATGIVTPIPLPGFVYVSTPSISSDGCCIAFEGLTMGMTMPEIFMMRTGQSPVRLTTNSAIDAGPLFSLDSQSIIFVTNRDQGAYHVYSMRLDGTGQARETVIPGILGKPTISPDGRKLVLSRFDSGLNRSILVELDRASNVETTLSSDNDFEPSYGPDGHYLVFSSSRTGRAEVMLMDLIGGGPPAQVTNNAATDGQPSLAY